MTQCAIISDIHGNLPALKAVLADIDRIGVSEIWCLGDIVGYGPQPLDCWKLVKERCSIIIMGNHEKAMVNNSADRFNARARKAIEWTGKVIRGDAEGEAIMAEIANLPKNFERDGILFVHGSPADNTDEYLMPRDARNATKMKRQFDVMEGYVFVGHTHFPGVIEEGQAFVPPEYMLMNLYMLEYDIKAIINVGSVGQPRDKNAKACYVTFDGDSVVYRRVPYNVQETRKRIYAIPALDNFLGDRIVKGQ